MVTPGLRLADIGTDHAMVPIDLVLRGRIPSALAMDIHEGPLARARENILAQGLEADIETRLSDGLKELRWGEADCVLIAGMGGALTIRILTDGAAVLESVTELVLAPQSEVEEVRRYVTSIGWSIEEERFITEGGKFYPMMRLCRSEGGMPLSDLSARYGPLLLQQENAALRQFLVREREILTEVERQLEKAGAARSAGRAAEIRRNLELNREACRMVGVAESVR